MERTTEAFRILVNQAAGEGLSYLSGTTYSCWNEMCHVALKTGAKLCADQWLSLFAVIYSSQYCDSSLHIVRCEVLYSKYIQ